jgi:hypothetical protein
MKKSYLVRDIRGLTTLVVALSLLNGCNQRTSSSPESSREQLTRSGIAFNNETFIAAARSGEVKKVLLFLEAGMNPDVADDKGRTGIIEAAGSTRLPRCKYCSLEEPTLTSKTMRYNCSDSRCYHREC